MTRKRKATGFDPWGDWRAWRAARLKAKAARLKRKKADRKTIGEAKKLLQAHKAEKKAGRTKTRSMRDDHEKRERLLAAEERATRKQKIVRPPNPRPVELFRPGQEPGFAGRVGQRTTDLCGEPTIEDGTPCRRPGKCPPGTHTPDVQSGGRRRLTPSGVSLPEQVAAAINHRSTRPA